MIVTTKLGSSSALSKAESLGRGDEGGELSICRSESALYPISKHESRELKDPSKSIVGIFIVKHAIADF